MSADSQLTWYKLTQAMVRELQLHDVKNGTMYSVGIETPNAILAMSRCFELADKKTMWKGVPKNGGNS